MPVSIILTDKDFSLTVDSLKDGNTYSRELISNDRNYIKLFASLFEYLWKNGIDAEQRLKEIECGYDSSIRVITNPDEILQLYDTLLRSSKKEIDIILPSTKSIQLIKEGSRKTFCKGQNFDAYI